MVSKLEVHLLHVKTNSSALQQHYGLNICSKNWSLQVSSQVHCINFNFKAGQAEKLIYDLVLYNSVYRTY